MKTFSDIQKKAIAAYESSLLMDNSLNVSTPAELQEYGDPLLVFIVNELEGVENIADAYRQIYVAEEQLSKVATSLLLK